MKRFTFGVLVLATVVSCAEAPARAPGSPTTTSGGSTIAEATEWMSKLCTIATDLRTGLWTSAKGTLPLRDGSRDQLDTAAQQVDETLDRLAVLPTPPMDGGKAATTQLRNELSDLRDALIGGRDDLDALPANASEQQVGQVMGEVWPRAAARAANPFSDITLSDAIRAAATGPTCTPYSL